MPAADNPGDAVEETTEATPDQAKPANPLEAIRQAQANRSLPPGSGGRGGKGGVGRGSSPKAPRMYNRHK
ncbi:hypothetical protein [Dactylosporangium sp. CA-233914]|uniref:hypothetical protein n=1 Tax=Dactylosporangium sp. CA-233914 TaxID=3239934 RepID=UPI003D947203